MSHIYLGMSIWYRHIIIYVTVWVAIQYFVTQLFQLWTLKFLLCWLLHPFSISPFFECLYYFLASPKMALVVKNLPTNAGDIRDVCLIPRSGRSPGGKHGKLLQYFCLENAMDRGAWCGYSP